MNRILLLLLLIFSINSYGQNYKVIYKNILHQNILKDESILKLAVSIIEEEAKLNPEMIYFRVHLLNEIYGNKNISNETNGKKELDIARRKFIAERNAWLNKQIYHINKNYGNETRANEVIAFFEDLKTETQPNTQNFNIEVDQNLMDFYVSFYLGKGVVNKYNKTVPYNNLRDEYENKIVNGITSKIHSQKKMGNNFLAELSDDINNNIHILIRNNEVDYVKLLFEEEIDRYAITNINVFGIGIFYSNHMIKDNRSIEFTNLNSNIPYILGDLLVTQTLAVELSYKLYLRGAISYFSYIDFSGIIFRTNSAYNINTDINYIIESVSGATAQSARYKTYSYHNIEYNDGEHYKFGLKFLTPIFVLNPNIIFELGVIVYYESVNYEITRIFDYTHYIAYYHNNGYFSHREDLDNQENVTEVNIIKNNRLQISPTISAKYINILNHIDIVLATDLHYYSTGIRLTY